MGMEEHERFTEDAVANLLEEAVQTSYRKGGEAASLEDDVSKQAVMKKIHALEFPADTECDEKKKAVENSKSFTCVFRNKSMSCVFCGN